MNLPKKEGNIMQLCKCSTTTSSDNAEISSQRKEFIVLTNSTLFSSCNTIKREKLTVIREIETEAWLFSTDFMFNYVLLLLKFYYADTKSWVQPKKLENKLLQKTKKAHHLHQKNVQIEKESLKDKIQKHHHRSSIPLSLSLLKEKISLGFSNQ